MKKLSLLAMLAFGFNAFAMPQVDEIGVPGFNMPWCSVQDANGKVIFADEFNVKSVMRLDGNLVDFAPANGSKTLWDFSTKNQVVDATYTSPIMNIHFEGTVDGACQPDDEGCENWTMKLKATISDDDESMEILDLTADCGV